MFEKVADFLGPLRMTKKGTGQRADTLLTHSAERGQQQIGAAKLAVVFTNVHLDPPYAW
jgi:hypothetical protein